MIALGDVADVLLRKARNQVFLCESPRFLKRGGPVTHRLTTLAPAELPVAHDFWPGLLRRGDDAHGGTPLRHGPLRCGLPGQPAPGGRDDRGWDADEQDGPRTPQGRPGPGPATRLPALA